MTKRLEMLALLVNAIEIRFVDEAGNGLVCHGESPGCQCGNRCEVKIPRFALMSDKKSSSSISNAATVSVHCQRIREAFLFIFRMSSSMSCGRVAMVKRYEAMRDIRCEEIAVIYFIMRIGVAGRFV